MPPNHPPIRDGDVMSCQAGSPPAAVPDVAGVLLDQGDERPPYARGTPVTGGERAEPAGVALGDCLARMRPRRAGEATRLLWPAASGPSVFQAGERPAPPLQGADSASPPATGGSGKNAEEKTAGPAPEGTGTGPAYERERLGQMRPRPRTASRSSSSSLTEASIRARENSLISRPWTISYVPSLVVTGKEEMRPSGTP